MLKYIFLYDYSSPQKATSSSDSEEDSMKEKYQSKLSAR